MAASVLCMRATAQSSAESTAAACPKAVEVTHRHLMGLWRAEFEGLPRGATLLLEPHPALAESVSGAANRDGVKSLLAGDVDEGEFSLEESIDGVSISATWLGDVVEGSCGREIRGSWQAASERVARPFVLRKLP
ncbi:MAG: hypothetical protein ABI907_08900 [Ramlibacter sp.]